MNVDIVSSDLVSASINKRPKSPSTLLLKRKQSLFLLISLLVHGGGIYFISTQAIQSEITTTPNVQHHIKATLYSRHILKPQAAPHNDESKEISDIKDDATSTANTDLPNSERQPTPVQKIQSTPQIKEKVNENANEDASEKADVPLQQVSPNIVPFPNILSSKLAIEGQTPQAIRASISAATQSYLSDMFEHKHDDLVNQAIQSHRSNRRSPEIKAPSTSQGSANEAFLNDIKVEVDCSTIKGKIFSMISANKGVQVQDRDFPSNNQAPDNRVGGTVKCRTAGDISSFINKRKERSEASFQ